MSLYEAAFAQLRTDKVAVDMMSLRSQETQETQSPSVTERLLRVVGVNKSSDFVGADTIAEVDETFASGTYGEVVEGTVGNADAIDIYDAIMLYTKDFDNYSGTDNLSAEAKETIREHYQQILKIITDADSDESLRVVALDFVEQYRSFFHDIVVPIQPFDA